MKQLEIGQKISKSGSHFTILNCSSDYYFAEQKIDNKIVAYEVGKIKLRKHYSTYEVYQTIPSAEGFGTGVDKSFITKDYDKALDYFNMLLLLK